MSTFSTRQNRTENRIVAVAVVAAAISTALCAAPAQAQVARSPAYSGARLVESAGAEWVTNGGNIYNQRYSSLTGINRDNIDQLEPAWRVSLNGSGNATKYSGQAQPLVHQGTIFVPTGANDVFAVEATTGNILWAHEAHLDPSIDVICCGWTSRGVGMGDGKIFSGQLDGKLIALDQRSGEVLWSIQAETNEDGFSITSAPVYYDGMVITGFAGGDRASRGRVNAYDADDGSLLWKFYTVPGPGEFGHDTWPQDNDAWKYGGASVWQTPAIDPELNLIYFSTGNPGPDLNGSVRPGDNLFSVSIVAIDARSGEYRWHFQQVHHDIWDYDSPNPVVLFDVEIEGRMRKGLAEVSKTGFTYILDRETGVPLIGIEERAVPQEPRQATAATQPYPIGDPVVPQQIDIAPEGWRLVNGGRIFTPFWNEAVIAKPRATGGANWPPSSYDPESNLLYVCAQDGISSFSSDAESGLGVPIPGERYARGTFGRSGIPSFGIFAAVDVTSNRLAWRQQWADICYSGSIVTAGGLVFVGRNDGRLTALDKSNGDLLWEFQADAGLNSTVTIFEHDGREYVVALAAGTFFPGTPRGDSLWLFSIERGGGANTRRDADRINEALAH
jgi:quinohemoprotein ethanol dehydrogenase